MEFDGSQALMIILALIVGGLVLRQLKKSKRRDLKSTSRMDDASGEEWDVFLSFRGPDTRLNFTDFLYHSLIGAGIRVFRDSEEIRNGEEISKVLKAVDNSRIYMPIFSRDFASSVWCLREVEHMVERHSKSNGKKDIIPIFHDVGPDDVKLRTDLYRNAIRKHKKRFASEEVQRWETALKTVGKIIGRDLRHKGHGEMIRLLVEEVVRKLGSKHVNVPEHLIIDHRQIKAIIQMLDVDSSGVRFVGIHGMGGIGKTTLAKVVFNKLCYHFDDACFLNDVRESSQHGLINLQKELVSSFVGHLISDQIKDIEHGIRLIKRVCSTKKVLIVLDDLDKKEQLEKLAGKSNWFRSGSRIIITTRDKSILMNQVESSSEEVLNQPEKILAYGVHEMEFGQALQLFYKHAFGSDSPIEDYVALSEEVVHKVGRLPLAVEVIGSFLYCHSSALEPHFDKIKLWEDTLKKLDRGPFKDVRNVLIISYQGLENEQKEVFLDIACFFTNENKTYPITMWDDCNYHPLVSIGVLLQRSLIKIGDDDKFWMHDQIRDLGRQIILEEYPRKFSRVWIHEDAIKLLEKKETNEDVNALSLTSDGYSRNIAPEKLAALPNLRFLRVKGTYIVDNFENPLLKLRWLFQQMWQTTFHPNNFHFRNLVMLDLTDSNIADSWGGWSQMKMNQLKFLNLTGCIRLKSTPDFSNFMSLEMLILARCVKLTRIRSSIGMLKRLRTLNVKGCMLLGELPPEIGSLQSLTEIIMPQNFQRFKLPNTFGNLESLSCFILDEHPRIIQLPNSIGGLVKLTQLSLRGCVDIKELPWSIGEMEMLVKLDLSHSGIVKLPDSIGYLKKLEVIGVSYTVIKKFPNTIGGMEKLEELHAKKCQHMTDENLEEIRKLSHLRILDLSYTHVPRFPSVLRCLSRLHTLELGSSHLQEIPDLPLSLTCLHMQAHHFPPSLDLSSLVSLDYLELYRLTASIEEPGPSWTKNLPEEQLIHSLPSGLSTLKVRGISLLPPFSNLKKLVDLCVIEYQMSSFSVSPCLIHLTELTLSECKLLVEIAGLSLLENLLCLDLNKLDRLVEIQGLSELKSLLSFHISHCPMINTLSKLSKLDKLQQIEIEDCPEIRSIEGLKGLESLELDTHGSNVLERLLDGERWTWLTRSAP